MNLRTIFLAAVILSLLLLITPPSAARVITAGEKDSGRAVTASLDDIILLTLPENPSTGYAWDMASSLGLNLLSDTYQYTETKLIGAGGTHIWKYQVVGTGTQAISGVYHRPWIPASRDDRQFSFSVLVESRESGSTESSCPYGFCKHTSSSTYSKKLSPVTF